VSAVQTDVETLRDTLLSALAERRAKLKKLDAYYKGEHKLVFATAKFREVFGNLFGGLSDNWCDLVVDASAERLKVNGFRFEADDQGDADAWEIWQRNGLDAESELAHTEAVKLGCSYALVAPDDGGLAGIQLEPPANAIVLVDPAQGRRRLAGLRYWEDEYEVEHAVLYTPSDVVWWEKQGDAGDWQVSDVGSGTNALGVVPLVPLPNAPTLRERQGRSDIERVIPLQDAVNKLCADMIVASEFAAFPQRWATGVEVPVYPEGDPNAGKPMPSMMPFLGGADRVWTVPDEAAKFGNFAVSDLTIYVRAIEMLIQHVAAQTRTPPHYLLGAMGSFPSGESLKATETGLVAKVRRKQTSFGEGWEEAIRLAFKVENDEKRAESFECEVIWENPESRSIAVIADAAVKLDSIGIPRTALWEFVGATPQQIETWLAEGAAPIGPPVSARVTIPATPAEAAALTPGPVPEQLPVTPNEGGPSG